MKKNCTECGCYLEYDVYNYSISNFNFPLCRNHQNWLKGIYNAKSTTRQAVDLYFALRMRGVPAELEKWDGFKTIDIAVTRARVNIEVDGLHHNYSYNQALSDLKRTYYSFKKGYLTLRIPNSLIEGNLEQTADFITDFLIEAS